MAIAAFRIVYDGPKVSIFILTIAIALLGQTPGTGSTTMTQTFSPNFLNVLHRNCSPIRF